MIANRQQLQTTLERITWCESQTARLRKTEPNRASYLAAASGLLAEIKRLQQEVRDYFSDFHASRGSTFALQDAIDLTRESLPASQAEGVIEHLSPSARIVVHDDPDIATSTT